MRVCPGVRGAAPRNNRMVGNNLSFAGINDQLSPYGREERKEGTRERTQADQRPYADDVTHPPSIQTGRGVRKVHLQAGGKEGSQILLLKEQRDVIDVGHVIHCKHMLSWDLTELPQFLSGGLIKGLAAAADKDVRANSDAAKLLNRSTTRAHPERKREHRANQ